MSIDASFPVPEKDTKEPILHRMVVLQPDEEVVCVIKRHPAGILMQYVGATAVILLGALFVLFLPSSSSDSTKLLFYTGLGFFTLLLVGILGIATKVYWQSQWVITTDSLTQVTQGSLFGAQVSALSFESLEDITVSQTGILSHMFDYGTLRAETAGERSKFVFSYCPDPVEYARKIIDAKEKYLVANR
jgi:hypothetical protein